MPQFAIVALHFRPPAKAILASLPAGCELILEPEPDNPYDPKAIRVLVDLRASLPISEYPDLDERCAESGHSLLELLESPSPFHLGYLPDSDGKLALQGGNREAAALLQASPTASPTLIFDSNGRPFVNL